MLKVRAHLLKKARDWFDSNNYVEVQPPILVPALDEAPNALIVNNLDKSMFLAKGFLPYGRAFADGLERVYTIMPAFRIEQPSSRHLVEYWRLEVVECCDLKEIMSIQEQLVAYLCHYLLEVEETLECFNRSGKDLARMQAPFSRLTYDKAVESLQSDGYKICWGQEINWELERHLSLKFDKPFFIWKYPLSSETFFSKTDPEQPALALYADLIAPEGYGELASSLQMITKKEVMLQRLRQAGVNSAGQNWFMELTQSRSGSCSGFAIGVERMLQWICKLPDIRETIAFPRSASNCFP